MHWWRRASQLPANKGASLFSPSARSTGSPVDPLQLATEKLDISAVWSVVFSPVGSSAVLNSGIDGRLLPFLFPGICRDRVFFLNTIRYSVPFCSAVFTYTSFTPCRRGFFFQRFEWMVQKIDWETERIRQNGLMWVMWVMWARRTLKSFYCRTNTWKNVLAWSQQAPVLVLNVPGRVVLILESDCSSVLAG